MYGLDVTRLESLSLDIDGSEKSNSSTLESPYSRYAMFYLEDRVHIFLCLRSGSQAEALGLEATDDSKSLDFIKESVFSGKPSQSGSCMFLVKSIYPFNGKSAGELSFHEGQKITVTSVLENPWWEGYIDDSPGQIGMFPSNFVQKVQ